MTDTLKFTQEDLQNTLTQMTMKFQITGIEFDLNDDYDCGEDIDTEILQDQLQRGYIGQVWIVDEEDELVDLISDKSGWCINSIQYEQIK
jgi:hypothetical protein